MPMILGPDGAKLSKRHGAADVMQYRDDGYLPHALLNYLVRLGWSHGDQEIFTREEMIALFRHRGRQHQASRLDSSQAGWLNQHYLKTDDPVEVGKHLLWHLQQAGYDLANGPAPADVVLALRDRVQTLKDMVERARPSGTCRLTPTTKRRWPNTWCRPRGAPLSAMRERLAALAEWSARGGARCAGRRPAKRWASALGKIAQPLRVAITGTQVSPVDRAHRVPGRSQTRRSSASTPRLRMIAARAA